MKLTQSGGEGLLNKASLGVLWALWRGVEGGGEYFRVSNPFRRGPLDQSIVKQKSANIEIYMTAFWRQDLTC